MTASRLLPITLLALSACTGEPRAKATPPLQPLIYTELPNLTPEAASVRERRLMRSLLEGASSQGSSWGRLKRRTLPATRDAESLGRSLFDALVSRDEALWEHAFVDPEHYSKMVHVRLEEARRFVDELLGKVQPTWNLLEIEHASQSPEGGLRSLLTYQGLELGQGRTVQGKLAKKHERVEQHWGNVLRVGWRDVVFEIHVPKILRITNQDGSTTLSVASALRVDPKLQTFIAAGLHLKPELLRSREYPYPMAVGNFWRYRRTQPNKIVASDPLLDPVTQTPDTSEVLLEVLSVERYESMRLIKLRREYNDQELTKQERHWLLTPRRVYACRRECVRKISDWSWLLTHLQTQTPLFQWPLEPGDAWGPDHIPRRRRGAVQRFKVAQSTANLEIQGGVFPNVFTLQSERGVRRTDPFLVRPHVTVDFVVGRGVVRRTLTGKTPSGEAQTVVEELLESRIMP